MIYKVFSIFDSAVGSYMTPFNLRTVAESERALAPHVQNPEHNFCKFAHDFTLFELGTWDESTGKYDLHVTPYAHYVLSQLKAVYAPQPQTSTKQDS